MYLSKASQKGQVLLIVVLVMVVSLTIGLSVVTRTITSLRTSEEEANSQEAFSAAEAGIEKLLNSEGTSAQGSLSNEVSFQSNSTVLSGDTILVNNGVPAVKDDGVDVWLSTNPDYATPRFTGTLTVHWGKSGEICDSSPSTNTASALELVLISGTPAAPVTTHYALDPCSSRASVNNFSSTILSGGTIDGQQFAHSFSLTVNSGLLLRIVPLYASTSLGINGNGVALPTQGEVIESTGSSGEVQRKITVYRGYPKVPIEFFPYVLFSP